MMKQDWKLMAALVGHYQFLFVFCHSFNGFACCYYSGIVC